MGFRTFVQILLGFILLMLLLQNSTFPKTAHIYALQQYVQVIIFLELLSL